jgi:hypothetical protein
MKVDQIIENFRKFLEDSWPSVEPLMSSSPRGENLISDWLQANWELLVEDLILPDADRFLEVYGDGADCNGSSSRVWLPDALPTHRVYCVSKSGHHVKDLISDTNIEIQDLTFNSFVSWDGKQYAIRPPFDCILLENRTDVFIVCSEEISFRIEEIRVKGVGVK